METNRIFPDVRLKSDGLFDFGESCQELASAELNHGDSLQLIREIPHPKDTARLNHVQAQLLRLRQNLL